ncbi:SWR1-complex protein 5 [Emericellopsis atlantica]|uniref:SWR1-complex protein 5 n=1 Tax=Emericellopsis atlantica TaxID=2614577 RepID=A0A9P8CN26_9HYPO|nr:SWR1-complex protein 5 [Emericellopsis atlantica]KAG9253334.1 SWR1-complex protein 5 [Emericellopsis atlantica]
MPPPLIEELEDEQYASSEDSDFAPDAVPATADSDVSDSEPEDAAADADQSSKRAKAKADKKTADDEGYDNSGDEAIIKKGERKSKRRKGKDADDEDEGGEGGLIKTRRQRAAEKEERRMAVSTGPVTVDVDALWADMISGKATVPASQPVEDVTMEEAPRPDPIPEEEMIRIKRTYNFAGKVHTEEKLVHKESAEAKLYFASNPQPDDQTPDAPPKRATRKAFRSRFEPPPVERFAQRADLNLGVTARREAAAKKLNTVEKSRMDWAGFVDKEGIQDELQMAAKSKESYNARTEFLARSEAKRDEDARRVRMAGRT